MAAQSATARIYASAAPGFRLMLAAGYPNCGSPYAEAKMIEPVTLGDLAHDGKLLWVYCTECGRERDIDPLSLPLPGETPVLMKRSACGSRPI
jgi:hypothetical protein